MKTILEELWGRIKTIAWTAFWVGLTFFVDNFAQVFVGISLPNIDTQFGSINTAVLVGLFINALSKFVHNYRAGKVDDRLM
jgi:hypothetical protein